VANGFVLFLLLLSERHNLTPASDLVKKAAASLPERVRDRPLNHDPFYSEVACGPFQD